jgi:DNA-cytosine methyltransferase
MVNYNCEKCGKEFKQKSHYTQHINKKTPCITENKLQELKTGIIPRSSKLNAIDLFCGCGGFTKGLVDAGINVIAGIDIWKPAVDSYKANNHHIGICKDLTEYPPEEFHKDCTEQIDIICGGPPCQGFSNAGKRDKNDPRNSLFMEFVKYLDYFKPKAFMLENVMGILSMKTGSGEKAIDVILSFLEKDYNCVINKLYASDFEVPQNRRRVIILGVKKELNIIPVELLPKLSIENRIPVSTVLLPKDKVDKKYYLSEKAMTGISKKRERMKEKGHGFGAQILKDDKPSYTIPARYWKDGYDALVRYSDTELRRLTELELKRIQTFPDDYILCGTKKDIIMQIGNAVACRFAYHLGKHILSTLKIN